MRLKKIFSLLAKVFVLSIVFTSIYFFCDTQTKGFRPYLILSNLPNDPRWEVPPLSPEEQRKIDTLLDQPFSFLGSGGWCYAFLGQDQKTVLKFYKHTHLCLSEILKDFSFQKLLLKSPPLPKDSPYFQNFPFSSCMLLYHAAKKRTGLLYVHLNKTEGKHKTVTLTDNIGIQHTIDLDRTEFIVQKKAELLIPHIHHLAEENKMEDAKHSIDDMLDCLLTFYKKGIRDYDQGMRKNFGYTEDGAITLDLSSFGIDDSLTMPEKYRVEIALKTKRLDHYLKKYQPELYPYFQKRLDDITQKD